MGGTLKMMADVFPDKQCYGFDTFEGFVEGQLDYNMGDSEGFYIGHMNEAKIEIATEYLKGNKNVQLFKGVFPEKNSEAIKDKKFCFVHLDTDIYKSTKECLEFFYPRMVIGGTILIHDYPAHEGVRQAVNNFFYKTGTKEYDRWEELGKNPMINGATGQPYERQLFIRKMLDLKPTPKPVLPPKFPRIYLPEDEIKTIIKKHL
jgi:hypothetical protein